MIAEQIRELLVEITGRADLRELAGTSPLLHEPVALDSLGGMRLLRAVKDRFGVDVAAEDLNLDALSSLDSLVGFVSERAEVVDGEFATMRKLEAYTPKKLYLVDATYSRSEALADVAALTRLATEAVFAAGGHVMKDTNVVFPNGAITLVMILAESHLSIHTWPEESLVAIDLFSCGAIEGRIVIDRLAAGLGLGDVEVRAIDRG